MTKIVKVSLVVLMGCSMLIAGVDQMKMYEVKSGKITYEIKASGEVMAGATTQTIGKKRVIFDAYGANNLTEENKIEKTNIMGQKKTTKTHTMVYMKEGMVYHVNFDHRRIMRMGNMGLAMAGLMGSGQNMKQSGEEMMKKMGGKKTGTDKVLGYSCDVWEMMGTKQCIYKGIPLRVQTDVMGIKSTEVATKAEFDISLSKDDFKLPDFPIYDMEGNKLDRNNLDAMDKKVKTDMAKDMDEMALKKAAFAKARREAGIKEGESGTKAQKEAMMNSMMEAMLPQMKKKFLAQEKMLSFGKECFHSASTVKEANDCSHKMDEMIGESSDPEDNFTEWNSQTKKETFGFIDQGLENMECVKKANSAQDIKQCMQQK